MIQEYIQRSFAFLAGLVVTAAGIAMILQANVGLEAWSVLQTGLSGTLGISYGAASIIVGGVIILTVVVLKESFGFGTVADILICGPMVDVVRGLNVIPKMESLGGGVAMLLVGLEVLVLGSTLCMSTRLGCGPRDALMVALARKTKRSPGLCRILVELFAIALGWALGGQVGIGTVIAAVGLGSLFNLNFALLRFDPRVHYETIPETCARLKEGRQGKT